MLRGFAPLHAPILPGYWVHNQTRIYPILSYGIMSTMVLHANFDLSYNS